MIKELNHDNIFLSQKAKEATKSDLQDARDLLETLVAHRETCVGMACNMIGVNKAIIAFLDNDRYEVMLNPKIVDKAGEYTTQETCLSYLGGPTETKRYRTVKVEFQDMKMRTRVKLYRDFTAQIIQHEVDHLNGILI